MTNTETLNHLTNTHSTVEIAEIDRDSVDAFADGEWVATVGQDWDTVLATAKALADSRPDISVMVTQASEIIVDRRTS